MLINIKLKKAINLIFCLCLLGIACNKPRETYENRVQSCLENAKLLEFEIEGSDKKGMSHNVEPECLLGVKLPNFKTSDINKNPISFDKIIGKINVINFWFIKCAPCIKEIPELNTLAQKYSSNEINFIAFTKDNTSELKEFLKNHPFNFTIVPNSNNIIKGKFKLMWGYPFTIITNKENTIIGVINSTTSSNNSISKINEILIAEGL